MATTITTASAASGNANIPARAPSVAEMALWKYCDPYAKTKSAIWIDPSSDWLYRNGGPADGIADFQLIDRIGGRRFKAGLTGRHPIVVTDSISGKPCLAFGGGGAGPNVLTAGSTGDLECPSILVNGVETNRLPLLTPGTGYSFLFATRTPVPSSTVNGIAWTAQVGGSLLGGGADDPGSTYFGSHLNTGIFSAKNVGTDQPGTFVSGGGDRRNGLWTIGVATYDATLGRARLWLDTAGSAPFVQTGMIQMPSTAAAQLPRIGAEGQTAAQTRLISFLGGMVYLPAPIMDDDTARAAAFAWLIERTTA